MSLTTRIAIVASSASIALAAGMLTVPASQATSIAPVVGWIHQAYPLPAGGGTIFAADSRGIAADASGNTYVTGSFSGQVTFGSITLEAQDPTRDQDMFLAKYSPSGEVVWAVRAGGPSGAFVTPASVAIDQAGNVYVAGDVLAFPTPQVDFGNGVSVVGTRSSLNFIVKYSPSGVATWAQALESSTSVQVNSLSVTSTGTVAFAGRFRTSVITNEVTLAPVGSGWFGLVGSMTAAGVTSWMTSMSSTSSDPLDVLDVAVDTSGNAFVTGSYHEDISLGDGLTRTRANASEGLFLARYAPNGAPMWIDGFTDLDRGTGSAVTLDSTGNVVVAGRFKGSLTSGSSTVTSTVDDGCFVARYSPTAIGQWAVGCESTSFTTAVDVAASGSTIYVLGDPRAGTTFGGVTLTFPPGSDTQRATFFVAAVSASGSVLWTEVAGATSTSYAMGTGIAAGASGRPVVTSKFEGLIGLGGRSVSTSPGGSDLLVASYAGAPSLAPETQTLNLATGVPMTPSSALTASNMQAPVAYSVSPVLPAGLTLDTATGVVTGTPATAQAPVPYTITGTDAGGRTASVTANIGVSTASLFPATQSITVTAGQPMEPSSPLTPSAMTAPVTYSVSPVLPAGLSFSTSAGYISGTPTTVQPATIYTVTGTDSSTPARTATATVTIQVDAPPVTKPGKVTNLKAKAKKGKVIVKWRPPTDTGGGAITGYQVRVGKAAWVTQTKLRVNVTSLRKGQKVTVRVRAVNEAGAGTVSTIRSAAR